MKTFDKSLNVKKYQWNKMTYSEIYKFYLLKRYPIEENFNSIIFKEVLNGNVHLFVVNETNVLVQEWL
jgi:hypothetical protein